MCIYLVVLYNIVCLNQERFNGPVVVCHSTNVYIFGRGADGPFLGTSEMNLNYNGKLGPLFLREFVFYTYRASGINDYIFVIRERMIYFLDRHFIRSYHLSRKSFLQCRSFWKFLLSFLCTIHHSTDVNVMQMRLIAFVFYYKSGSENRAITLFPGHSHPFVTRLII